MKQYFRTLQDSLIPGFYFPNFQKVHSTKNHISQLFLAKKLIESLPKPNYQTLNVLSSCMKVVVANTESNKMTPSSLAICVASSVLRSSDPNTSPVDNQAVSQTISTLLFTAPDFFFNYKETSILGKAVVNTNFTPTEVNVDFIPLKEGDEILILEMSNNTDSTIVRALNGQLFGYVDLVNCDLSFEENFPQDDTWEIVNYFDEIPEVAFLENSYIEKNSNEENLILNEAKEIDQHFLKFHELQKSIKDFLDQIRKSNTVLSETQKQKLRDYQASLLTYY